MSDLFQNAPPYIQALIAGIITWLLTALGAAAVFIFKKVNDKVLNSMQGFAAGIMIAASFWSLLQPAIESSENSAMPWLPAAIGFILGGVFIRVLDYIIPHIHQNAQDKNQQQEGVPTSLGKNALLVLAITLHNIPEGLSIGVAFGGVVSGNSHATFLGAIGLAIVSAYRIFLKVQHYRCQSVLQVQHVGKHLIMDKLQQLLSLFSLLSVLQQF